MKSIILFLVTLVVVGACNRTYITSPSPTPTPTPTTTPLPVTSNTIEFRVLGNATNVNIVYSFPTDGITLVTSVLPYDVSYSTSSDTVFLSLSATPITYPFSVLVPFLSVQIFANGNVFREATSSDFLLNTISVSGTWRK